MSSHTCKLYCLCDVTQGHIGRVTYAKENVTVQTLKLFLSQNLKKILEKMEKKKLAIKMYWSKVINNKVVDYIS